MDTSIDRFGKPDLRRYHALVRRVGEPYLWQSPLTMTAEQLEARLRDGAVEIFALRHDGEDEGILQLDFQEAGECELALFGVSERLRGTGAARRLMNYALARGWSRPIARLWLHTCTLDHPDALPFYIRTGFVPFKRKVEIHDDPRITGLYPRTTAPGVPLL